MSGGEAQQGGGDGHGHNHGHDSGHGHGHDSGHGHGHDHDHAHGDCQGHGRENDVMGESHAGSHGGGHESNAAHGATNATSGAAVAGDVSESDCESVCEEGVLVGGLILRGNRCVLARSLDGEWEGMRIPWIAADRGETIAAAALRAVVELCDIEAEEVYVLAKVPPVAIAVPSVPQIRVCALYAKNPPPPGPLEAADCEDPEDAYDWYTFPRAMYALPNDVYARVALTTMACALAAGAAAGTVPYQWGGVFGQEWTDQAFKLVPGGLKLERPGCTNAALAAGSAESQEASLVASTKRSRDAPDEASEAAAATTGKEARAVRAKVDGA
eukprot:TRINITY_DN8005_c0_g1_i1.p1 TRINITY_DN8005_c0_g1~~TRINITY_DN8005_c0_g1_i1.p1  ORF type:complete len:328 (+),score=55.20 TRINITY_DN8005_c0_g1_i1:118-1101(+)